MPRKSKSQPVAVTAPGQPYGIAGDQQAAMKSIPLPNTEIQGQNIAQTSPSLNPEMINQVNQSPNPVASEAPSDFQSAIMAAMNSPEPTQNAFSDPTARPSESLLTMPMQPNVKKTPTSDILRMMAEANGNDPALMDMAASAALKGY